MVMLMLLLVGVVAAAGFEPPALLMSNEELRGYLLEAAENNPGLKARHAEWLAALERIPQAKSLEDPMFTYSRFIESDTARDRFALEQKFPWFGTLRAQKDMAVAEADAALAGFYAERNQVFAEVKRAYFEYAYLGEDIRITTAQVDILSYIEEIARSRYALALTSEEDLLRIQIERTRVEDRLNGLLEYRPALSARLAAAIGLSATEGLTWPQAAKLPSSVPDLESLLGLVHKNNPDLATLDHLYESRQKQIKLARKKGFPDFTLGVEYTSMKNGGTAMGPQPSPVPQTGAGTMNSMTVSSTVPRASFTDDSDEAEDEVMLMFQVNLPIWRTRVKAGVQEAQNMAAAVAYEKGRTTLDLDAAAQNALFMMEDALRRYRLYAESLVPKAQQTFESVQSSYTAGLGADFLDLLDAERMLLDFHLEERGAARDVLLATADLELLTGGAWTPWEKVTSPEVVQAE